MKKALVFIGNFLLAFVIGMTAEALVRSLGALPYTQGMVYGLATYVAFDIIQTYSKDEKT